jgi:hypothetical protein
MKSILPPELERKRLQIAKIHNRLVIGLLISLFAAWLLLLAFASSVAAGPGFLLPAFVITVLCEGYGLYRVFQYDKALCLKLNFMYPHCHKPLYEPRSFINVTGRCPKCKETILD